MGRHHVRRLVGATPGQGNDVIDGGSVDMRPTDVAVDRPMADLTDPAVAFEDLPIGVGLPFGSYGTAPPARIPARRADPADLRAPLRVRLVRREVLAALHARPRLLDLTQRLTGGSTFLVCLDCAVRRRRVGAVHLIAAARRERHPAVSTGTLCRVRIADRQLPSPCSSVADPCLALVRAVPSRAAEHGLFYRAATLSARRRTDGCVLLDEVRVRHLATALLGTPDLGLTTRPAGREHRPAGLARNPLDHSNSLADSSLMKTQVLTNNLKPKSLALDPPMRLCANHPR